ncbi:hypothetical protein BpHYR1_000800 [Brachionus plicatilis]|uniref:Uncharacterized protein n=1 Tax=Brachionus plicatilis TaxID=10195 RepID=A0A3M7PTF0_BRAPC|nr:hypothetical protein BpHYR1_000800 [Brachionus plicatilis]
MDGDFGREGRWECRCAHSQRLELDECKLTIRRGGEGIEMLQILKKNKLLGSNYTMESDIQYNLIRNLLYIFPTV